MATASRSSRSVKRKTEVREDTEPDYTHRRGEYVHLAPPEPLLHKCPECTVSETRRFPHDNKVFRLTYLRSLHETWGTCITRHDVYRCRACRGKFVSTNGREPELAADWV